MAPSTQIPIFATPMSDFTDFCPIFAKIGHAATADNLINSPICVVVARRDRRGRDVLVSDYIILLYRITKLVLSIALSGSEFP